MGGRWEGGEEGEGAGGGGEEEGLCGGGRVLVCDDGWGGGREEGEGGEGVAGVEGGVVEEVGAVCGAGV